MISEEMKSILRPAGVVLAPVVIYLLLASRHAADPFTNDETWEFYASKTLLEEGKPLTVTGQTNALHPHGYYYLVSGAFRLLGVGEVSARCVGITATVLCYLLILRLVRVLSGKEGEIEPRTCFLVGLFYLLSPMVVQGSLVITADTGIHHLVILLFLVYFVERYPFTSLDLGVLAGLFALCLWAKIVAPCLVLGSVVLWLLYRREWLRAFLVSSVAGGGGLVLFFWFWTGHCHSMNADPLAAGRYIWKVLTSRKLEADHLAGAVNAARGAVIFLVWIGPPVALLLARTILHFGREIREGARPLVGPLLASGCTLLLVDTVVGGIGYGFPRYHATMMPIWGALLALYADEALGTERPSPLLWAGGAAAAAWLFLVAGDPLLALNFDLKASALRLPDLLSPPPAVVALTVLLFLAPLAAGLVLARRLASAPATAAILILLAAAHSLSLNVIQARADYLTHYSYGEKGTREMLAHCSERLTKGKKVLSCMDVVYHLADHDYMEDWNWNEKDFMLERLNDRDTQLVVMGLNHNTLAQHRRMTGDAEFKEILERRFTRSRIGSYIIWERKKDEARVAATQDHGAGPSS